jgi:L-alanine-DL-glutamate epimerase-like enolase superfamily enzyme
MSNIRIREVRVSFEEFAYRAPMKFRATVVDRVTILNVTVDGEVGGRITQGFGSMPLGNVWSFPSARLTFDQTLAAMKQIAAQLPPIIESCGIKAHPIEINHLLEPMYLRMASALDLTEPVPPLCTLVVASAFDAAIHDAYGKAHSRSVYRTYGSEFMNYDLSHYLDDRFCGEYVDHFISSGPAPALHLYHLVGALDPLTEGDVAERINDGLPETLEEWIRAEGIDHIKIKLDGDNLRWDVERILSVYQVVQSMRPGVDLQYSLDFNERCQSVEYVLECLASVWEAAPAALSQIRYIEQPTPRDLYAPGTPAMYKAAKVKPVVIDESLTDYASLLRARELGYSGVALKACKGQSNALLMAAAAQKFGMFLCVQDLTCPGASLLHSAGLAAHIPPISAIESNARQYVPAANRAWESRFPGIFHVAGGRLDTSHLNGPGLGIVPAISALLRGA